MRSSKKTKQKEIFYEDCDDNFAFIAGYTPGGLPFGIKWDEVEDDVDIDVYYEGLPFD